MKLHFCGISWVCLSVWWYYFPYSYWQLKWCACCCCFLQGLVRSGDPAVQVLLVFLKLVLPLLILESMDLCPALESSPSAVPSHLCHHRKVRCQLAYCCSNKIMSLSCKEEVLTSCNLYVIRNSDCCVPMALLNRIFDRCFGFSKMERKIPISLRRGELCFGVCETFWFPLQRASVSGKYLFFFFYQFGLKWEKYEPVAFTAEFWLALEGLETSLCLQKCSCLITW